MIRVIFHVLACGLAAGCMAAGTAPHDQSDKVWLKHRIPSK